MDKNHNSPQKRTGRPRLSDSPLRRYWRMQKQKTAEKKGISGAAKTKADY